MPKIPETMMKNLRQPSENGQVSNRLLVGTAIQGTVKAIGDFRIDGVVEGRVEVDGKFVLGEKAEIKGDLIAREATISGKIKGNITASEVLVLKSTAQVEGDIVVERLVVEGGARFLGRCQMGAVVREIQSDEVNQRPERAERVS
jgi:cytoskeletal protein CcmA (bactofilin family)